MHTAAHQQRKQTLQEKKIEQQGGPAAHHVPVIRGEHLGRMALRALGCSGLAADLALALARSEDALAEVKRLRLLALAPEPGSLGIGPAIQASSSLALAEAQWRLGPAPPHPVVCCVLLLSSAVSNASPGERRGQASLEKKL